MAQICMKTDGPGDFFSSKGIPMSSPKEDCTSHHPGGHSVMVVH